MFERLHHAGPGRQKPTWRRTNHVVVKATPDIFSKLEMSSGDSGAAVAGLRSVVATSV